MDMETVILRGIGAEPEINEYENLKREFEKISRRLDWCYQKLNLLQKVQKNMRDPERQIICDILANGQLLPDPEGKRYGKLFAESKSE